MKQRKKQLGICLFTALTFSAPSLHAFEGDLQGSGMLGSAFDIVRDGVDLLIPEGIKGEDLRIRLGVGFGYVPDYGGSDDYRFRALPLIDLRYKKRLRLSFNQLSYAAVQYNGWEFGPLLRYKGGRSESRNPVLTGLGDIKATAQLGAFARYQNKRMLFNLEFREALGAGRGSSIRATFGHALYKKDRFVIASALTARWLSDKAAQTNFGITGEQALTSEANLDAYTARSGVSRVGGHVLMRYDLSDTYRLLALGTYERLLGDAVTSPLVANGVGSANQFRVGVGFTIDF